MGIQVTALRGHKVGSSLMLFWGFPKDLQACGCTFAVYVQAGLPLKADDFAESISQLRQVDITSFSEFHCYLEPVKEQEKKNQRIA